MTILIFFLVAVAEAAVVNLPPAFNSIQLSRFLSNSEIQQVDNRLKFDSENYKWENNVLESSLKSVNPGYRLEFGTQKIENSEIPTVTETHLSDQRNSRSVEARTVTFSGAKLRSVTLCNGQKEGGFFRDTMKLSCITATRQFCENVNRKVSSLGLKNLAEVSKKSDECKQLLHPLARVAEDLSQAFSLQTDKRREEVISQDQSRIENQLVSQTRKNFSSAAKAESKVQSEKLYDLSQGLRDSIEGLGTMVGIAKLCREFEMGNRTDSSISDPSKKPRLNEGSPSGTAQ